LSEHAQKNAGYARRALLRCYVAKRGGEYMGNFISESSEEKKLKDDLRRLNIAFAKDHSELMAQIRTLRCDGVECHHERDILASLYDAADKLPPCGMLAIVVSSIQEIQALRESK
jgi:hypothetical protein